MINMYLVSYKDRTGIYCTCCDRPHARYFIKLSERTNAKPVCNKCILNYLAKGEIKDECKNRKIKR